MRTEYVCTQCINLLSSVPIMPSVPSVHLPYALLYRIASSNLQDNFKTFSFILRALWSKNRFSCTVCILCVHNTYIQYFYILNLKTCITSGYGSEFIQSC